MDRYITWTYPCVNFFSIIGCSSPWFKTHVWVTTLRRQCSCLARTPRAYINDHWTHSVRSFHQLGLWKCGNFPPNCNLIEHIWKYDDSTQRILGTPLFRTEMLHHWQSTFPASHPREHLHPRWAPAWSQIPSRDKSGLDVGGPSKPGKIKKKNGWDVAG